jgi:hypothetical protein
MLGVLESISQAGLPLRQQLELTRHARRLNPQAVQERREILRRTYGCLDDVDAAVFEEAMTASRSVEANG